MLIPILLFIGVIFVVYAIFTQYSKTPTDQSASHRAWASLVAAAGVIGAAIASWFHGVSAP